MSIETQFFSRKNLDFLLFDVLKVPDLNRFDFFRDHNLEAYKLILDIAREIAAGISEDAVIQADRQQPELIDNRVAVHPAIHDFVQNYSEAGFTAAPFSNELGGFHIPKTVMAAIDFMLSCSANSFIMYTDLAKGIANLIATFGTEDQKVTYLPHILSGKWLGTMCLTETESGSSLAHITSIAFPVEDGIYKIKGQKIFISAGDHDITENIIHLVLARIAGAPNGTKGISLFIVPKRKVSGADNDVSSIGIYHKMGQKATPAMHLEFGANDECYGYLLGEANKGLNHMFLMMDSARLSVGSSGVGIASSAYYTALQYAKERKQGRRLNNENPASEPVTIIQHPDVRRMLLHQKAFVEGSLSLILQCYLYLDIQGHTDDPDTKKKYTRLLNLLTPVAKSYGAEKGVISVNQALQVLGGYGYTQDFPLEQLARDVRILPIYEGTTGIHSLGLLKRQVLDDGGQNLEIWHGEVEASLSEANRFEKLKPLVNMLSNELNVFRQVNTHLQKLSEKTSPEFYLADSWLYLEVFGTLNIAWQWIKQGITVQEHLQKANENALFYESKMMTLQHFFDYEVSKLKGFAEHLLSTSRTTLFDETKEILI